MESTSIDFEKNFFIKKAIALLHILFRNVLTIKNSSQKSVTIFMQREQHEEKTKNCLLSLPFFKEILNPALLTKSFQGKKIYCFFIDFVATSYHQK
jgi:hypothetical protein